MFHLIMRYDETLKEKRRYDHEIEDAQKREQKSLYGSTTRIKKKKDAPLYFFIKQIKKLS